MTWLPIMAICLILSEPPFINHSSSITYDLSWQQVSASTIFFGGHFCSTPRPVAFGMGIDKPDIRTIIHYGPTSTLEEYYQQVGPSHIMK